MTNQRKSFIVSVFVILALALGVMLISQGLMARVYTKPISETVDAMGGPLSAPLPGDVDLAKPAITPKRTQEVISEGREVGDAVASTENGGETYALATVIASLPYVDNAGTTVGAVHDYDETLCGGAAGAGDVVYLFTAPFTGEVVISTCNVMSPANVDTKIWLVEDVTFTELACNDDDPDCGSYASTIIAPVTAGTSYYIVVGAYGPGSETAFFLNVAVVHGPGEDIKYPIDITFPLADTLTGGSYPVDLTGVLQGNASMTGSTTARTLYYRFISPANGMITMSWCDDGTVPYAFGRWTAISNPAGHGIGSYGYAPNPLVNLAYCTDNGPYELVFVMIAGNSQTVEILTRQGEEFKGTLTITREPLPLYNDDCADAEDLLVGPTGDVFGHNLGATRDGPGVEQCSPSDPSEVCADVWYVWEADATGFARFDMCSGETDNKLWVYAGDECLTTNPREAVQGGCSDDACGVGGGPSFGEVPCTIGDRFLIRIAGWYIEADPTYGDCEAYGMGVFYINCEVFPTSIRPANNDCVGLVPDVLADAVTLQIPGQTYYWAGWDCLPTLAGITFETNVWHAITLTFCTDTLEANFCGTAAHTPGAYAAYLFSPLFTGCPCSGDYVIVYASLRGTTNTRCTRDAIPVTPAGSRVWLWRQLIPGDYYMPVSQSNSGITSNASYFDDYQINFRATSGGCVYCAATANVNSCPPVAGATWIDRVSISDLVNPALPTLSGCNAYQNFTAVTPAKVYRGFPYTLTVRYGRTGGGALGTGDSCDVWVDWNQNSGLAANQSETGERTRMVRVGPDVVCTINVPLDAYGIGEGPSGMTYMRVRMANSADGGNAACGTKTWGEVEDYLLNVVDLECGDFDIDGDVDATDISFLRAFYFGSGPAPVPTVRGDIDGDGFITIADIIALSDAAYRGGLLNCM